MIVQNGLSRILHAGNRPTEPVGLSRWDQWLHRTAKGVLRNRLLIATTDRRLGIGRPEQLRPIQGAPDAAATSVQHMSVDHRRTHVLVTKQFLHGPNVIVVQEQMSGKTVSKDMGRSVFVYVGLACRLADGLLHHRLVQVKTVTNPGVPVDVVSGGGEDPLPAPLAVSVGIFSGQCRWQGRTTSALGQVRVVLTSDHFQMLT